MYSKQELLEKRSDEEKCLILFITYCTMQT